MAYSLAKDILRKRNATAEEIEYAISLLPISGHKAVGLRARLKRKLDGRSYNWQVFV